MPAERVLTERALNRAVLARQGLLEPLDRTIPQALTAWERRRADLFAAAEDWVGPPPGLSAAEAGGALVRSYLKGFGPASRGDVASYSTHPTRGPGIVARPVRYPHSARQDHAKPRRARRHRTTSHLQ